MKLDITLGASNTATVEERTVFTAETLELAFHGTFPLPKIIYEARNGERSLAGTCKEWEGIDLSPLLTEGFITVQASAVVAGQIVRTWNVEPIIVREADHGAYVIPEITALEERADRLEAAIRELNQKINEL